MIYLVIFTFILVVANCTVALMYRKWHSSMGWFVAGLYILSRIIEK